mmetsp:Transcript_1011/g.2676  ORF Transcript_1011/g.2676 Transcript_1011/m.2676 type:complete len:604 (+) Transcript_1011:439-2250(+)
MIKHTRPSRNPPTHRAISIPTPSRRPMAELSRSGGDEPLGVTLAELLELRVGAVGDGLLGADGLEQRRGHLLEQADFEGADVGDGDLVEVTLRRGVNHHNLLLDGHGHELALLEHLGEAGAAVQEELRRGVEVRAELRERGDFAVLRQLELERPGHLFHRLHLRRGSDAGHREADVDGRADTLEEELRFEEDLPVGDGDDVGGDVRGDVAALRLDDGERRHGPGSDVVAELRRALQEAGVEVEDVTRERLASGGTAEEQGHLAVRHGLLGEVIVDDERVHAVVAEVLGDGGAGVGREELERRRVGRGRGDDDGVVHRALVLEQLIELRHRRSLLSDGDVDAVELFALVGSLVDPLLVDDGVDGDRGLANLAISDDELALAAADGHERVDSLQAGLHGFVHGLADDDARRLDLDALHLGVHEGAFAVDGQAEAVHDAAEHAAADGDVDDGACALDDVSLADGGVGTEAHDTDVVVLEVERHALDPGGELDHLASLNLVQAVHARDAVAHGQHAADLVDVERGVVAGDALLEQRGELLGVDAPGGDVGGVKPARDRREPLGLHRAQGRGGPGGGSGGVGRPRLPEQRGRGATHHRVRATRPLFST